MNEDLKNKILEHLTEFEIRPDIDVIPEGFTLQEYLKLTHGSTKRVSIQRRNQRDGSVKWVISNGSGVASKECKSFVYDSMPSNRTDEHIDDTRFSSIEEALQFSKELNLYGSKF